jgi:hypothetical protein
MRGALLLLVAGPIFVAVLGEAEDAPIRLRLVGLAAVVAAALTWDDRIHALTASTPVGLPAVRRGRGLLVMTVIAVAFSLSWLAVPAGVTVPVAALALQTVALVALLLALVGWFGRDGEPVLALPAPALLLVLVALNRLPHQVALLRADPSDNAWPAERNRWLVLLAVAAAVALRLGRDPASRGTARGRRRTTVG